MRNASPKGLSPFACLSITIIIVSAHCCGANQSVRNTPVRSLYRRVHIDACAAPAGMRVVANPLIVHLNVRIRKLVWHQGSSRSTFSNTIGSMQVQKSLLWPAKVPRGTPQGRVALSLGSQSRWCWCRTHVGSPSASPVPRRRARWGPRRLQAPNEARRVGDVRHCETHLHCVCHVKQLPLATRRNKAKIVLERSVCDAGGEVQVSAAHYPFGDDAQDLVYTGFPRENRQQLEPVFPPGRNRRHLFSLEGLSRKP